MRKTKPNLVDTMWDNVKQIGLAVVLAVVIKTSIVEAYKIPSESMEDTLLVGDFLLANKFVYGARLPLVNWRLPAMHEPERGEIIIFVFPRDGVTKYIKRCVGLPGDTIEVKDKELYVNGEHVPLPENGKHIQPKAQPRGPGGVGGRDNFGPFVVPDNYYFMMGDNRDNSYDSRFWGPVHKDLILGKALIIHWSWDEDRHPSPEVSVSDPMSVPRVFLFNAYYFYDKVRWERLLNLIS